MCFGSLRAAKEKTRQVVRPAGKFEATQMARSEALLKELSHGFYPQAKDVRHKIEHLETARTAFLASSLRTLQAPLPEGAGGQFQHDQEGRDGTDAADEKILTPLKAWLADYGKAKHQMGVVKTVALEVDSFRHDVGALHVKMGKQKARQVTQASKAEADLTAVQEALNRKEAKVTEKYNIFLSEEEAAFQMLTFLVQGAANLKAELADYTRKQVREQGKSDAFLGHMEPLSAPADASLPAPAPAPRPITQTAPQGHPQGAPQGVPAGSYQAAPVGGYHAAPQGVPQGGPTSPVTPAPTASRPLVPSPPPFPEVAAARQNSNPFHTPGQNGEAHTSLPDIPRASNKDTAPKSAAAQPARLSDREQELATNPFLQQERTAGDHRPEAPKTPAPGGNWPVVEAV